MARDSGNLDLNSPYTYLMLCRYFADTCVVAEEDGEPLGFILGYRMPERPESVFVWQVTTSPAARGRGLATSMMAELLQRHARQGGSFLEATVTPSNTASQRLFRGVARKLGVPCEESLEFPADLFPGDDHEEEVLFRIGPFCADSVRTAFATPAAATTS